MLPPLLVCLAAPARQRSERVARLAYSAAVAAHSGHPAPRVCLEVASAPKAAHRAFSALPLRRALAHSQHNPREPSASAEQPAACSEVAVLPASDNRRQAFADKTGILFPMGLVWDDRRVLLGFMQAGFGQQSAPGFLLGPGQQQQPPQSAGVLATVDNKQLTHYTKWEEINPQGQKQLLELE